MADIPFPYPILNSDGEDIDGTFDVDVDFDLGVVGFYMLDCKFKLQNAYFENLIKTQQAVYTVEVECASTNYRETFLTTDETFPIKLSYDDVRGLVDIRFYICASKDIPNYKPIGMNADIYGDDSFEIKKGEIIATHARTSFIADPKYDSLNAPIRSFVKLKQTTAKSGEMLVDCEGDFIEIELSKDDHKLYNDIHTRSPELVHSCIVLPVLVDVLHDIDKYSGYVWADKIKQICLDRGIDIDNPIIAAQKLLGLPINRTFKWRKNDQDK